MTPPTVNDLIATAPFLSNVPAAGILLLSLSLPQLDCSKKKE